MDIRNLDAHHRGLAALVVAVLVAVCTFGRLSSEVQLVTVWNSFALTAIALAWVRISTSDALTAVRTAKLQDTGRANIFIFVTLGTVASLMAVASLLAKAKEFHGRVLTEHVLLAIGTVVCSWTLLHTIFTLHYAHLYYGRSDPAPDGDGGTGLQFPNEQRPDFVDFAYFSFVIGMTCQVSDVQIKSKRMRWLALLHGVISFGFNTFILALLINTISGLL